jgi:hypothetical protein
MAFDIMYYQYETKNDCPSTETFILLAPVLPFCASELSALADRNDADCEALNPLKCPEQKRREGALPARDPALDVATPDACHRRPLKFLFTGLRLTIATTRPLWRAQQDPGRQ